MNDRLMTPREVAEFLQLGDGNAKRGVKTLEYWRRSGQGPAYRRLSQKVIRYSLADVQNFAEGARVLTRDQG